MVPLISLMAPTDCSVAAWMVAVCCPISPVALAGCATPMRKARGPMQMSPWGALMRAYQAVACLQFAAPIPPLYFHLRGVGIFSSYSTSERVIPQS